jgi:hypothetical protein
MAQNKETCGDCKFFIKNDCMRNPPYPVFFGNQPGQGLVNVFPLVKKSDWCGEFKEKPKDKAE